MAHRLGVSASHRSLLETQDLGPHAARVKGKEWKHNTHQEGSRCAALRGFFPLRVGRSSARAGRPRGLMGRGRGLGGRRGNLVNGVGPGFPSPSRGEGAMEQSTHLAWTQQSKWRGEGEEALSVAFTGPLGLPEGCEWYSEDLTAFCFFTVMAILVYTFLDTCLVISLG